MISKEVAAKIELLQNPSEKNKTVRHAIITGETGEYGGWQKDSNMKLKQRWLELFGGYENENEGCNYQKPDFLVSSKCCYYLKEKNCDNWGKEHNSVPFLGLMASEGGRRAKSLRMLEPRELYGCQGFPEDYIIDHDYTGKTYPRSEQVKRCGNAVCPPIPAALVRANLPELCVAERTPNMQIKAETTGQLRFA